MAWTTPRTWVTNEVVTAALLNTHVRDNLNFLRAHHGCRVFKSAAQTVAGGNTDVITWNSEDYDTDTFHDNVTNNTRLTIPAGYDGYYQVTLTTTSDADGAANLLGRARIRKNSAGSDASGTLLSNAAEGSHTSAWGMTALWQGPLVAGDYIEGFFFGQTEAHDLQALTSGTSMALTYLGS